MKTKKIITVLLSVFVFVMAFSVFFSVSGVNTLPAYADDATAAPAADATADPSATADPNASTTDNSQPTWLRWVIIIVVYAALFGLMYLVLIRPQQKKRKQEEALRSSLMLGDSVTTIGGIVGKVVKIQDDDITIETSIDRSLITVKNWAIRDIKKLETESTEEKK